MITTALLKYQKLVKISKIVRQNTQGANIAIDTRLKTVRTFVLLSQENCSKPFGGGTQTGAHVPVEDVSLEYPRSSNSSPYSVEDLINLGALFIREELHVFRGDNPVGIDVPLNIFPQTSQDLTTAAHTRLKTVTTKYVCVLLFISEEYKSLW